MLTITQRLLGLLLFSLCFLYVNQITSQTQIRGFIESYATLQDGKVSFGFGEQDLFITSEINDRLSFLGESVFKFSESSHTSFNVSIERVVIKYNYWGNHNLLIGKHHTPLNYWNDSYHHGRVFFPTIGRPILFQADIIPIHTTGISLQGLNLGDLRFGYELMIGNGLGSEDIVDNDKQKSITAAIQIKPLEDMQIRASYYKDAISEGADIHGDIIMEQIDQQLFSGSLAYFGNRWELLAEATLASNKTNSTGNVNAFAAYIYAGLKIKEKWVPYFRIDRLNFNERELYFHYDDATSFIAGLRYEINYLAVTKLEFQHEDRAASDNIDKLTFQIAIGF